MAWVKSLGIIIHIYDLKVSFFVKKDRPVYLNLAEIQLHAAGFASILHRISGLIMFVAIGFLLYFLEMSLASEAAFEYVVSLLKSRVMQFGSWAILTAFFYHLIAGVRHLIMDSGHWEELQSGRLSAYAAIGFSVLVSLMLGSWIWL
jgi:succinate dehydrogenase / fumarate reductase cytochrome b subunit